MTLNFLDTTTVNIDPNGPFGTFLTYLYLFIIGSFCGYILEVLFRRFCSMKRWINPGFLTGPCLPLYGFGLMLLHFICDLGFKYMLSPTDPFATNPYYGMTDVAGNFILPLGSLPYWAVSLIVIALIGVGMTVLELLAGLIFIKGLKIKLWDYSKMKGNFQGIICPLFSVIWLVCGAIYWFGIRPGILDLIHLFVTHAWGLTFLIGIYYGILIIDFAHSLKLAFKVRGAAIKLDAGIVNLEKFKINLRDKAVKDKRVDAFLSKISESIEPVKTKISKKLNEAKAHLYVNNEIPTGKNESETPRTIESENSEK